MSRKNVEDLTKVTEDQIDSLILYYRKMDEIKRTRFYNFYKKNPVTTSIRFKSGPLLSIDIDQRELDDENDEFLRSFVAVIRLFTLDSDRFSLRYLGKNYFQEDDGPLFNLFPSEAKQFNELRKKFNDYLNSPPQIKIKGIFGENSYSFESNWEIFQSFAYGGLIHSNWDKIKKYYAFNLHRNEGKNVTIFPLYRRNIIWILLNITSFIDIISERVINEILRKITDFNTKFAKRLIKENNLINAWKRLENVRYILDHIEDNTSRLVVYKKLEDLSRLMNDQEKVKVYRNAYNDIKRVVDGVPPDFSDYKFSAELKKHE
ncbi:hypothetical protein ES705_26781 [subsurface metagenome]